MAAVYGVVRGISIVFYVGVDVVCGLSKKYGCMVSRLFCA